MSCPLGAVNTTPGNGHQMRVPLVERSVFEEEQNVLLNPDLQAPYRKQDALGLAVARYAPVLAEARRECLLLLVGWSFASKGRVERVNRSFRTAW